jgi:hypothetical protein
MADNLRSHHRLSSGTARHDARRRRRRRRRRRSEAQPALRGPRADRHRDRAAAPDPLPAGRAGDPDEPHRCPTAALLAGPPTPGPPVRRDRRARGVRPCRQPDARDAHQGVARGRPSHRRTGCDLRTRRGPRAAPPPHPRRSCDSSRLRRADPRR